MFSNFFLGMRKLSGQIICPGKTKVPKDSIVYIQAMECFYDNHPNILGSITIESAQSFPILFEILIDETPILKNCFNGFYLVYVNIERNNKLIYNNNGTSFVHEHLKLILDNIDVKLNEIKF